MKKGAHLEKLVGDSLRKLRADRVIPWFDKPQKVIHTPKGPMTASGELDFVGCAPDGRFFAFECKETDSTSLPKGQIKDNQREVLHQIADSGFRCGLLRVRLVIRYYTGDVRRNSRHFQEHFYALGPQWVPQPLERGGIKQRDLDAVELEMIPEWNTERSADGSIVKLRTGKDLGLTTKDKPVPGLDLRCLLCG